MSQKSKEIIILVITLFNVSNIKQKQINLFHKDWRKMLI